jgi:hypothetical protein
MSERPFLEPGGPPEPDELTAALGDASPSWSSLVRASSGFGSQWSFTGRGGWMLKVFDRKKALLYLVPLREAFRVSLTIREAERTAFLDDESLAQLHDQMRDAKRFPEGYALYFEVTGAIDIRPLESFVGKLVAVRRSGN